MRIKFEKGFTPERMCNLLLSIINEDKLLIGSVNVFIQLYDENGKAVDDFRSNDIITAVPGEDAKGEYADYSANMRRRIMKVV